MILSSMSQCTIEVRYMVVESDVDSMKSIFNDTQKANTQQFFTYIQNWFNNNSGYSGLMQINNMVYTKIADNGGCVTINGNIYTGTTGASNITITINFR